MKTFFLDNKDCLKPKTFINYGKNLYNNTELNLSQNFDLPKYHLKNLYYKYVNTLLPVSLSEIYEYANSFDNLGPLARAYQVKSIIDENKNTIEHKHIIFFCDYHFKRLFSAENILIDGTYIFPIDFTQTIIIMHYDLIIYKFIPSVFILINNKSYNGYKNVFSDILDYIKIYKKEVNTNLNWRYFTTDFEPALIKTFKDIFNDTCITLQHHGCYFHFLKNIRKKLISKGYNS